MASVILKILLKKNTAKALSSPSSRPQFYFPRGNQYPELSV